MQSLKHSIQKLKNDGINTKMLPIKGFAFFLNLGVMIIFPYLTLQMRNIGLSMEDVSLVYGAVPLTTFLTSPVAGYIGDKIGYNIVLVVNLILAGLTATAFDWTPRFYEFSRNPTISAFYDNNTETYSVTQFVWPPFNCNGTITLDDCSNADILVDDTFWSNLTGFLRRNETLEFEDFSGTDFEYFEVINPPKNGSLCKAIFNSTFAENTKSFTDFQLTNFPNDTLSSCFDTEGSHSKTFWIYFVLRMGYQISLISCYSSLDGTALRQSREFNSDYSWVMVYSSLAAAFGPLISSLTIKDAEEGSGEENDYSIAFYAYDACLLVALLISLKLKVTMNATDNSDGDKKQKKKENRQEIRELFNSSALIFFAIIFQGGLMWGVRDTYLFIYLQEELKASSQLLAYANTFAVVSGVLVLPFAKWIIESMGHIHICYWGIIIECCRMVIYSLVEQKPPYYGYALAWLDFWAGTLYWTAAIKYAYKIAPPALVGTMAALTGSVNWIIAKGLSSFIAGQLLERTSLNLQKLFQLTSIFVSVAATIFYVIFWIVGRKLEVKRAEIVEEKRLEMEEKAKKSSNSMELIEKPPIEEFVQNYGPSAVTLEDPWGSTNL